MNYSKFTLIVAALGMANVASAQNAANGQAQSTRPANAYYRQQNAGLSQPVQEKTRAQVYQELVQAEQDGSLARMNATTYAHH